MAFVNQVLSKERSQARLSRIVAVREQERTLAAEGRERSKEAKAAREARSTALLRRSWEKDRDVRVSEGRRAVRRAEQEEGSAHRAAAAHTQAQRADAVASAGVYSARRSDTRARNRDTVESEEELRAERRAIADAAMARRAHIAGVELQRARSAVASLQQRHSDEQRQASAQHRRQLVSAADPGLHVVTNPGTWRGRTASADFARTDFHKLLLSKPGPADPVMGLGEPVVVRHVPKLSSDGVVEGNAVDTAVAYERMREQREAEERALQDDRDRLQRGRFRDGLRKEREGRAQQATAAAFAEEEKLERRRRVAAVAEDCRFCEEQQAEQRRTQMLEAKLNRDFQNVFVRPDLGWHVPDKPTPLPPSRGRENNTSVLLLAPSHKEAAKAARNPAVSLPLRELWQNAGDNAPKPTPLPHVTAIGWDTVLEPGEEPGPATMPAPLSVAPEPPPRPPLPAPPPPPPPPPPPQGPPQLVQAPPLAEPAPAEPARDAAPPPEPPPPPPEPRPEPQEPAAASAPLEPAAPELAAQPVPTVQPELAAQQDESVASSGTPMAAAPPVPASPAVASAGSPEPQQAPEPHAQQPASPPAVPPHSATVPWLFEAGRSASDADRSGTLSPARTQPQHESMGADQFAAATRRVAALQAGLAGLKARFAAAGVLLPAAAEKAAPGAPVPQKDASDAAVPSPPPSPHADAQRVPAVPEKAVVSVVPEKAVVSVVPEKAVLDTAFAKALVSHPAAEEKPAAVGKRRRTPAIAHSPGSRRRGPTGRIPRAAPKRGADSTADADSGGWILGGAAVRGPFASPGAATTDSGSLQTSQTPPSSSTPPTGSTPSTGASGSTPQDPSVSVIAPRPAPPPAPRRAVAGLLGCASDDDTITTSALFGNTSAETDTLSSGREAELSALLSAASGRQARAAADSTLDSTSSSSAGSDAAAGLLDDSSSTLEAGPEDAARVRVLRERVRELEMEVGRVVDEAVDGSDSGSSLDGLCSDTDATLTDGSAVWAAPRKIAEDFLTRNAALWQAAS